MALLDSIQASDVAERLGDFCGSFDAAQVGGDNTCGDDTTMEQEGPLRLPGSYPDE